jgi:hypothetical protein
MAKAVPGAENYWYNHDITLASSGGNGLALFPVSEGEIYIVDKMMARKETSANNVQIKIEDSQGNTYTRPSSGGTALSAGYIAGYADFDTLFGDANHPTQLTPAIYIYGAGSLRMTFQDVASTTGNKIHVVIQGQLLKGQAAQNFINRLRMLESRTRATLPQNMVKPVQYR